MTIEEYQNEVNRTCGANSFNDKLMMATLGLAGESGEVADTMKKHWYHAHELDAGEVIKELGDVLWYLTLLSNTLGFSLQEVMQHNTEKLRCRYPDGFSSERSINRWESPVGCVGCGSVYLAPGEDPPRCRSCADGL